MRYFYYRVYYIDKSNEMNGRLVALPCYDDEEFQKELEYLSLEPEVDKIIALGPDDYED